MYDQTDVWFGRHILKMLEKYLVQNKLWYYFWCWLHYFTAKKNPDKPNSDPYLKRCTDSADISETIHDNIFWMSFSESAHRFK